MRIIFCSSIFDLSEYEDMKKKSKVALTLADHNLNYSFIQGLDSLLDNKVTLINSVPTPSFPAYRKILIKNKKWHHISGANDVNVGFINLPILKQLTRKHNIFKQLKKEVTAFKNEKLVIMTYDIHLEQAASMVKIKKKYPNVTTCAIMPDIPTQMLNLGAPTKVQRIMAEKKMYYAGQMDTYVFLTEYMKECIDVSDKRYTVVEGMYNYDSRADYKEQTTEKKDCNIVLYTGNLREKYGIEPLIEAVRQLACENGSYELWICGRGELEGKISDISKESPWLKYLGYVTPPKLYDVFAEATVLVNPRQNNMGYTRYSFPSKTLEYLASGKPIIAYKLDGIPDEYDEYLNYVTENGDVTVNLRDKIYELCSLPITTRQINGEKARKFILTKKNPKAQCRKIVAMMNEKVCEANQ